MKTGQELEPLFRQLTLLRYDTGVPMAVLDAEVMPYVADDVTFTDPWQTGGGRAQYRLATRDPSDVSLNERSPS